jgi:DNA polymerase I-like protein with 3'-5' exonuclease and polymerase domains
MAKQKFNLKDQIPLWGGYATSQVDWRPTAVSQLAPWAGAKRVAIDLETHDPELRRLGPGVRRGAKVVGISFAIEDGPAHYLPIGHPQDNLDPDQVWAYMRDQSAAYDGDIVGANLPYDLDFLWHNRCLFPKVKKYRDVQIADPLINELHESYSLDNIAARWGLPGKDERVLRQGAEAFNVDPKKGLWQLPGRFVADYAIQDVRLPLAILRRQEREIENQNLWQIYDLETKLLPILVKMRRRGVAIDFKHLQHVEDWTVQEQYKEIDKIKEATGVRLGLDDFNKATAIVPCLKAIGISDIPQTAKTKAPSIDRFFLEAHKHPVTTSILRAKKMDKLRGTFCKSVREHAVHGRIHATFNQLRKTDDSEEDDQGGRYGRLSCTDPNLQQQPARDPETGKLWRKVYIPDEGKIWAAKDYSQQEPRLTYHYAFISGCTDAEKIIKRFCEDLKADSHTEFTRLVWPDEREGTDGFKQLRGYAKQIFLGICYGMGGAKLCRKLGLPTAWRHSRKHDRMIEVAGPEGQAVLDTVDRRMPFLRQLARKCEERAKQVGHIVTLLGRRCRFPKREDGTVDWAHKALNRLIQGSAADQTKLAVVMMDEAGYNPQLQVHDEIDSSVSSPEEAEGMADIMRNCVKLSLPSKVDVELGKSWGDSM